MFCGSGCVSELHLNSSGNLNLYLILSTALEWYLWWKLDVYLCDAGWFIIIFLPCLIPQLVEFSMLLDQLWWMMLAVHFVIHRCSYRNSLTGTCMADCLHNRRLITKRKKVWMLLNKEKSLRHWIFVSLFINERSLPVLCQYVSCNWKAPPPPYFLFLFNDLTRCFFFSC